MQKVRLGEPFHRANSRSSSLEFRLGFRVESRQRQSIEHRFGFQDLSGRRFQAEGFLRRHNLHLHAGLAIPLHRLVSRWTWADLAAIG